VPHVRRAEGAMRPGGDPVIAAILAEKGFIERALVRLRVPSSALPDLAQGVTVATWQAARRGGVTWRYPPALRAFLFVVATRLVCRWFRDNPPTYELHGWTRRASSSRRG
jgi:hypothetical protein